MLCRQHATERERQTRILIRRHLREPHTSMRVEMWIPIMTYAAITN